MAGEKCTFCGFSIRDVDQLQCKLESLITEKTSNYLLSFRKGAHEIKILKTKTNGDNFFVK